MLPSLYIYFRLVLWPNLWSILENAPCALEKKKDMLFTAIGLPDLGNR